MVKSKQKQMSEQPTPAPENLAQDDYKLIPLSDITEEARKLAVVWCENYRPMGSINLEAKHKLASDIMNYARRYAAQLQSAPKEDKDLIDSYREMLINYDQAVKKFDSCRACLARVVEKLGIKYNKKSKLDWHEQLINAVDKYIDTIK